MAKTAKLRLVPVPCVQTHRSSRLCRKGACVGPASIDSHAEHGNQNQERGNQKRCGGRRKTNVLRDTRT